MFGYNPYYIAGAFIGGIIGIYFFNVLFRFALLGRSGTKLQQMWVVLLTGIVAIGFSAFGDGTNGFVNRISNPADLVQVVSYSLSALVVALLVWWRMDDTPPARDLPKTGSIIGRSIAVVFVIPMILIGLGNIAGSAYGLVVAGPLPAPGLGVSRAEFREIMLSGHMAPFWRVVNEQAPAEMDNIINQMFAREDEIRSVEEGMRRAVDVLTPETRRTVARTTDPTLFPAAGSSAGCASAGR